MSKYDFSKMLRISEEEIKKIDLELLEEFNNFCEANNLRYVLDGGSLIGAIRHKGFIPWDDDIDVVMPYPDYLKFIELFNKQNQKLRGEVLHGLAYEFHYAKICDKRTVVKRGHRKDSMLFGVWIDVFPMYSIDDDDDVALEDIRTALYWGQKSWRYLGCPHRNPLKALYHKLFDNYLLKKCLNNIDKIVKKYPYGSTKRIRVVPIFSDRIAFANNDHFDNRLRMKFEEKLYYVPHDYHDYLRNQFGDYMQLPSIDQRISHEIEAFWK